MERPEAGKARGVLRPERVDGIFHHERHLPAPDLAPFVAHFWSVAWDLRGCEPRVQETLPHPAVHIVFEPGNTRVGGVARGRFSRRLEGQGHAFGIKFHPAGFHPFFGEPLSVLTDTLKTLPELFGDPGQALEDAVLGAEDDAVRIELAETFLRAWHPEPDPRVELLNRIAARIAEDREIRLVEDISERFSLGTRTLQRLFGRYVGVSPKWVIQRYRLHEALAQVDQGHPVDWASLALDLGYFDQAHFIKDFKALVGRTPASYAELNRPS
ncbi:MAG TPA: helix-turn-helix domain-containing protein [Holophagaceae bacterium]|jgi:AraC-like DNA-binding protein|nr:helix-turn-helix domain-containing protein [Holophagaceae bacterium]